MQIERTYKSHQSIVNFLIDHLDQFKDFRKNVGQERTYINGHVAEILYKVWKNPLNKISDRIYKRPITLSLEQLREMQKEGLIHDLGDKIEITDTGSEVIKIMILGDDVSTFDKKQKEITYAEALYKSKERSLKTSCHKRESNWWAQIIKR